MKLLLVFVSALVLAARGDVAPVEDGGGVYEVKPEVVAGYAVAAGQEAEDAAPQGAFSEQAPGARAFGAEEIPRAYAAAGLAAEGAPASESGVDIPSVARACSNYACYRACRRLGYRNGWCTSLYTCRCYR